MPRIPTYRRQVPITAESPNAPGSIQSAGVLGQVIGRESEQFLNVVEQQQEAIRRRDNANKLLIIGAAYDDEQRAFETMEGQKKGQDSYDNMTRGAKFREDAVKKYTTDVTDPDLKHAVVQHIFSRAGSMLNGLATHQARERDGVTKLAIENMTQGVLKDAYAGADLAESLGRARLAVKTQQAAGAYDETGAIEILLKAEKNIAEAHLDGLINRDPVAGMEAIKSGKYSEFLDQKSIESFDNKAKQIKKAMDADAEHAAVEAKRLEKEQRELARQEANKTLVDIETSGKLTRREVMKYRNTLNENEYREWQDRITRRNEKAAKASSGGSGGDDGFKTNKSVQLKFYRDIISDPERVSEADIVERIGDGLSYSAAKELISEKRRREKGEVDPIRAAGEREAIGSLRRARKDGLFGEGAEGEAEFVKQVEAFKRWSAKNPTADPSEYIERVMEPVARKFWFDKVDPKAQREAIEREMQPAKKHVSRPAPTGPKPGQVVKGYRFKGGNPADKSSWVKI